MIAADHDRLSYFEAIVEAFDGMVYVCSADNRIEFVNRQVTEQLENRRHQYERVDSALAAGWPRERIEVIDDDQGNSGGTEPPMRAPASRAWASICWICSVTSSAWTI